jgi:hypothetical protein
MQLEILRRGNEKLGRNVYTLSATPKITCPAATEACKRACYAVRMMRYPEVKRLWASTAEMMLNDPAEFGRVLSADLSRLSAGSLFRLFVSGDIPTAAAGRAIAAALDGNPHVTAWIYTRAWRRARLHAALAAITALPNVTVWHSTDDSHGDRPVDTARRAHMFRRVADVTPGFMICPQQTGRKSSCQECGICFRARGSFNLAFLQH